MGVTFWGNFASRILLVPFHWRGMCYAHQFSREGSPCEKLKTRRQILGRPSQAQFQPGPQELPIKHLGIKGALGRALINPSYPTAGHSNRRGGSPFTL